MSDSSFPDALPAQYMLYWYVLERVLGQGGFGITYLARDSNLDKLVAIKEYLPVDTATRRSDATVSPRSSTQSERYASGLEGFIREARTLARFSHPNIVRVHSVFQHNNTAYMVMEYEEGETLAALLERRKTLPENELQNIVLPIIDGLSLVHAAGFIHRDIKPDNILIRNDVSPVLLDFGSARSGMGQSRTVTILVAPGYAPFEQYYANGESQGPWTDIYGLGATCYRAITGEPPVDAIARSKGVLGSTREVLVPASARGARRYSAQLLAAVDHALAFSERDRPQSLEQWRRELTGDVDAHAAPVLAALPAPALAPVVLQVVPRTREMLAWAGLGAALTALAILFWQRSGTSELPQAAVDQRPSSGARAIEPTKAPDRITQAVAPAAVASSAVANPSATASTLAQSIQTPVSDGPRREPVSAPARTTLPAAPPPAVKTPAPARTSAATAPMSPVAPLGSPPQATSAPVVVAEPAVPSSKGAAAGGAATVPVADAGPAKPETAAASGVAVILAAAVPVPGARDEPRAVAPPRVPETVAPSDDKGAFEFYQRRARTGDGEARFQLGDRYEKGKGVAQSNFNAYIWFGLASCSGQSAARSRKAAVAARLQPAEIRQADHLVDGFVKGCL